MLGTIDGLDLDDEYEKRNERNTALLPSLSRMKIVTRMVVTERSLVTIFACLAIASTIPKCKKSVMKIVTRMVVTERSLVTIFAGHAIASTVAALDEDRHAHGRHGALSCDDLCVSRHCQHRRGPG